MSVKSFLDTRTYGSMNSSTMSGSNDAENQVRPRNIRATRRSRNRTLSTSEQINEVFGEIERFGRRTISISQPPPDLDSLPAVAEDEDSESEQRNGNVNEVGDRQDELAIS